VEVVGGLGWGWGGVRKGFAGGGVYWFVVWGVLGGGVGWVEGGFGGVFCGVGFVSVCFCGGFGGEVFGFGLFYTFDAFGT